MASGAKASRTRREAALRSGGAEADKLPTTVSCQRVVLLPALLGMVLGAHHLREAGCSGVQQLLQLPLPGQALLRGLDEGPALALEPHMQAGALPSLVPEPHLGVAANPPRRPSRPTPCLADHKRTIAMLAALQRGWI